MVKYFIIVLSLILTFNFSKSSAQDITGLWEFTDVKVGEQIMTPVAKWTRINEDGTYQSGNGWLQNSEGTWKYDSTTGEYLPNENNGIKDSFGAFKVKFEKDKMIWQRIEEGENVTVSLNKIDEIPKSPADKIIGLWKQEKENINSSKDKSYLFLRWDRIYIEQNEIGQRKFGYWNMHAHKPELTLLRENEPALRFNVEVTQTKLTLTGISEENANSKLTFIRINEFPK